MLDGFDESEYNFLDEQVHHLKERHRANMYNQPEFESRFNYSFTGTKTHHRKLDTRGQERLKKLKGRSFANTGIPEFGLPPCGIGRI